MSGSPNDSTPEPTGLNLTDEERRRMAIQSEAMFDAMARRDADKAAKRAEEMARQEAELANQPAYEPPETVVMYNFRLHWVKLLSSLMFVNIAIVMIVAFTICFFLQLFAQDAIVGTELERLSGLTTYIFPLLPAVLSVIVIIDTIRQEWRRSLTDFILWFSDRWIIDTSDVTHDVNVKGVVLNLIGNIEDTRVKIPRSAIINPSITQSWLGELLGYAELSLGNASEQDSRFKRVKYLRHPKKLKEIFGLEGER